MTVKLTPRKAPRQERARALVESILVAAERLSRDPGLDAWTTNHVAELAGASIGSLYQYFPSKQSLVTALYTQRRTLRLAALADALIADGPAAARGRRAAAALLAGGAAEHRLDLQLRAHLVAAGADRKLRPLDDQAAQLLAQLLAARGGWPAPAARRIGALIAHCFASLVETLATDRADWLADPGFARELGGLLAAMLAPPPPPPP